MAAVLRGSTQRLKHPGRYEQPYLLRADFCRNGWLQSSLPLLKANHNTLSEGNLYLWFKSCPSLLSAPQARVIEAVSREQTAPQAGGLNPALSNAATGH